MSADNWIPAVWKAASRSFKGRVSKRDWANPHKTGDRGFTVAFMIDERLDFDDLPVDAHVIIGVDSPVIQPGDILSVKKAQIKLR